MPRGHTALHGAHAADRHRAFLAEHGGEARREGQAGPHAARHADAEPRAKRRNGGAPSSSDRRVNIGASSEASHEACADVRSPRRRLPGCQAVRRSTGSRRPWGGRPLPLPLQGAPSRRPSRLERHLAGVRHGQLGHSGSRGAAGPHPEIMGAYGAGPAGQSIVEGGEIPYQPWALAKKKENFDKRMKVDVTNDKTWHETRRPGAQMLHAGCAARDVHAVSVSDRAGVEPCHSDGLRVHECDPHRPHELEGGSPDAMRGWAGRAAAGKATRWSST